MHGMSKSIHDKIAEAVMTIPERALRECERITVEPHGAQVCVTYYPPLKVLPSEGWDG